MKRTFRLQGLDCAHCASKIERDVQKLPGVQNAVVSFMTTKMTIEADDEQLDAICEKAKEIVAKYEPDVVVRRG